MSTRWETTAFRFSYAVRQCLQNASRMPPELLRATNYFHLTTRGLWLGHIGSYRTHSYGVLLLATKHILVAPSNTFGTICCGKSVQQAIQTISSCGARKFMYCTSWQSRKCIYCISWNARKCIYCTSWHQVVSGSAMYALPGLSGSAYMALPDTIWCQEVQSMHFLDCQDVQYMNFLAPQELIV